MKHYVNHEMIDPELSLIFHFRMTYARNPTYYIDVCCQKLKNYGTYVHILSVVLFFSGNSNCRKKNISGFFT